MRGVALAAALLLPALARAAAGEPAETVRVEGEGEKAPTDLTGPVTIIRASDFASRITTLAELLEESAGLRVRSYGGLGAFATVSMRGSTAEQVDVYVDGVLLNPALGGGVSLGDLSLNNVEAIEIYRGFTPSYLPGGSIGGAINIRTKIANGTTGTSSLSYGSYGTTEASGAASRRGRRADGLVSLDLLGSSGDFTFYDNNGTPLEGEDDGFETRRNNRFWTADLAGRAGVDLDGGGRFDLQAGFTRRRQGVPGIDAFQSESARSGMSRALVKARLSRDLAAVEGLRLDFDAWYTRTTQEFTDRSGDTTGGPSIDTEHLIEAAGPSALMRWHPRSSGRSSHYFSVLAAARRETARLTDHLNPAGDDGRAMRFTGALSIEDEIHLAGGRFILTPSARWTRLSSRFRSREDVGDSRLTGRLGAAWLIRPRLSLRASAGRFYREPSFLEIFGNEGSVTGGGPDLRPEAGSNYDLGLSWDAAPSGPADRVHIEASAFLRQVDDLIQFVLTSQSRVTAANTGRAVVTGAELSAGLGLFGWFHGSLDYTWQVARDRSDTFARGGDLPGRPRHDLSARAGVTRPWGHPYYGFTYLGPSYFDAAAATVGGGSGRDLYRVPGRYLHDVGFTRPLGSRFEMTLEVDNIFNVLTVDVVRYPLPGRLVQAKLRMTLP
ncbi:MAG TPA: TonB-dependent receptor [Candidatus Polarisedimenticolia bacterium]|jgi:iron complex outermembrane receptor protein